MVNNVSVYSLTSESPDQYLANQDVVDWVSASVAGNFGGSCIDIPAGISFCIMIPRAAIEATGLMDPVFGRGYCEELDWSLRSKQVGLRTVLGSGVFVYHVGGGSNVAAGLVSKDYRTVDANERIIDMRFPLFRTQVEEFMGSGLLGRAITDANAVIVRDAGRQFGYRVVATWLPQISGRPDLVSVLLAPDGSMTTAQASFLGYEAAIPLNSEDVRGSIVDFFGVDPTEFKAYDGGHVAGLFADLTEWDRGVPSYPSRV